MYIVMEHADGGDLQKHVGKAGRLLETPARHVLLHVLRGVRYLHSMSIVHSDIALRNIVIERGGVPLEDSALQLTDFGSAAFMDDAKAEFSRDVWQCGSVMNIILSVDKSEASWPRRHIKIGDVKCLAEGWEMVSPIAINFASSLLRRSAASRPTAEHALAHVWFKQGLSPSVFTEEMVSSFLHKLRAHAEFGLLKKLALFALAHLEEDARCARNQDFMKIDGNGDGLITAIEVRDACTRVGLFPPADLQELLVACDFDSIGAIDRTTFLSITLDLKGYDEPEVLSSAFKLLDVHGLGKICEGDWSQVALSSDTETTGDIRMDLDHFVSMLTGENCIPPETLATAHSLGLKLRQRPSVSALGEALTSFLDRLDSFERQHAVKKGILLTVAQLELMLRDDDDIDLASYFDLFNFLDSSGEGLLTPNKITEGCKKIGIDVPERVEALLKMCHPEMCASIDRATFLAIVLDIAVVLKSETARLAFQLFDLEGKGYITLEDLRRKVKFPSSVAEISEIIRDEGENGHIEFDAFASLIRKDCRASFYRSAALQRLKQGGDHPSTVFSKTLHAKLSHIPVPRKLALPPADCDVPNFNERASIPPSERMKKKESVSTSASASGQFESGEFASTACSTASTPRTELSDDGIQGSQHRSEKVWRQLVCSMKQFAVNPPSPSVDVSYAEDSEDSDEESFEGSVADTDEQDASDNDALHSDSEDGSEDNTDDECENQNNWRCRLCASENAKKNFICQTCGRGQNPAFA